MHQALLMLPGGKYDQLQHIPGSRDICSCKIFNVFVVESMQGSKSPSDCYYFSYWRVWSQESKLLRNCFRQCKLIPAQAFPGIGWNQLSCCNHLPLSLRFFSSIAFQIEVVKKVTSQASFLKEEAKSISFDVC